MNRTCLIHPSSFILHPSWEAGGKEGRLGLRYREGVGSVNRRESCLAVTVPLSLPVTMDILIGDPAPTCQSGKRDSMTAMTLTEKILARHAGRDTVRPGDNVWCNVDILLTHDVCGPG